MTKVEVLVAIERGEKVAHSGFTPDEWMKKNGNDYEFEDGCICTPEEFWRWRTEYYWESGWRIWT